MTAPSKSPEDTDPAPSSGRQSTLYNGRPDELHDLFGAESSDEEDPLAALRNDPNYAELIRELEYIAVEARKIFASAERDPSDKVWKKIQDELNAQSE